VTLLPLQIAVEVGEIDMVGSALIVAVTESLVAETQPVVVFLACA
jgi:hypothetical protein